MLPIPSKIAYSTWKTIVQNNSWATYHYEQAQESLIVYAGLKDLVFCAEVDDDNYTDWNTVFSGSSTSVPSANDAMALIIGTTQTYLTPVSPDGKPYSINFPTEGVGKPTYISHNWCDKCTWAYGSTHHVDVTLTDTGDGLTFSTGYTNLIDTYHGRITEEDGIVDKNGNSCRVSVTDANGALVEKDPHDNTGDYVVNYESGEITFDSAPTAPVTATFNTANTSEWLVTPEVGKVLKISKVEAQFSNPIEITDSIIFQPVFNHPTYGWIPVPGEDPTVYKTLMDFINEANGNFPEIPKLGGSSWRGMPAPIHTFPWDYKSMIELPQGTGIRIKLEHDTPFGGAVATAAFYMLSEYV